MNEFENQTKPKCLYIVQSFIKKEGIKKKKNELGRI